jgi:hypothetical protein
MPAESASTPLSRRTVVKAAAWSVPVVALAVAAPSAAASITGSFLITQSPNGDPQPNHTTTAINVESAAGSPSAIVTVVVSWPLEFSSVPFVVTAGWTVTLGANIATLVSQSALVAGSPIFFSYTGNNGSSNSQSLSIQISAPGFTGTNRSITYGP